MIAVVGIAATPLTFGLSLLGTAFGIGMLTWDSVDYSRDHVRHAITRRRLRELDLAAKKIGQELDAIMDELDRRSRDRPSER